MPYQEQNMMPFQRDTPGMIRIWVTLLRLSKPKASPQKAGRLNCHTPARVKFHNGALNPVSIDLDLKAILGSTEKSEKNRIFPLKAYYL